MKKSIIYTRTGDLGTTSLVNGDRVSKSDTRLEAYGNIDELNSWIGVLASDATLPAMLRPTLTFIQHKLFNIGAYLATPNPEHAVSVAVGLGQDAISRIEHDIDALDEQIPPLRQFVLPGGSTLASFGHVARTVCRRTERSIVALSKTTYIDPDVMRFINRLSDYLFILSRFINIDKEVAEIFWQKDC